MYEKDGEKYFIFDSHLHFWDASPGELGQGRRGVRQGLDRVLPRLPGPRPGGDALVAGAVPEVLGRGLREGRLHRRRHVDMAVFQSTYLKEWYTNGFNDDRAERRAARALPGQG